jgi:hypothetical protein
VRLLHRSDELDGRPAVGVRELGPDKVYAQRR